MLLLEDCKVTLLPAAQPLVPKPNTKAITVKDRHSPLDRIFVGEAHEIDSGRGEQLAKKPEIRMNFQKPLSAEDPLISTKYANPEFAAKIG